MWYPSPSSDELYHYGVLGMRWGIRRYQNYDGTLKAAGKKHEANKRKGLSDETKQNLKRAAKITGGVLLGAAVVGGTIYLAKTGKLDDLVNKGKDILLNKGFNIDKTLNMQKVQPMTISEAVKNINPLKSDLNCAQCTMAYELKRRGYNVFAKDNPGIGTTISKMGEYFKGINSDTYFSDWSITNSSKFSNRYGKYLGNQSDIMSMFANDIGQHYPKGSRGAMMLTCDFGSHWISWEIDNSGTARFLNPQDTSIDLSKVFTHYHYFRNSMAAQTTCMRLDNLEINPSFIHENVLNKNRIVQNLLSSKIDSEIFDTFLTRGKNYITKWSL